MELKYDPRYCSQCYQYDPEADILPEACRTCFGDNRKDSETSFEAAFIVLADIDGKEGADITEGSWETEQATAEILSTGDSSTS